MKLTMRTPVAAPSRKLVGHPVCHPPTSTFDELTARHYEAIAKDPKYQHFVRIPRRIVRCLDFFGIHCQKAVVERRLRAYYLFIGVIDNAIDSHDPYLGRSVLRQLESQSRFDNFTNLLEITLLTEGLRLEISDEIRPELLGIMRMLSRAVEQERTTGSLSEYIQARKRVGRLTARASYVLICPLLSVDASHIRRFMEHVGEIGCLVDSIIDLHADRRSGLLNFRVTPMEFVRLLACTVTHGAKLAIRYPQLWGLFGEAVADNVWDSLRPRNNAYHREVLTPARSANTTEQPRQGPFCKIDSLTVK
jgi:hypothetical protein